LIFVDTNVLLDLVNDDPRWASWSVAQLTSASIRGVLAINDAIYAELSVRYRQIEDLDAFVEAAGVTLVPMPRSALFLAGKAYFRYRQSGGLRTGVLPDFFIGAHSAVLGVPLLTRDAGRYGTYFPTVELISP
jgi:predicted nucleic acid-binding protein